MRNGSDNGDELGHPPDELADEPDDDLEEEFPVGDGTAEGSAIVACPYCGETVEITLDPGSGDYQEYVEDCEVCCRPWQVTVTYGPDGEADVVVQTDEGS